MIKFKTGLLFASAALSFGTAAMAQAQSPEPCPNPRPALQGPPGGPGGPRPPRADPYAGKKKILFIGDTLTGNQGAHDSVYHAMAVLQQLGAANDIAVFIRTDWNNITAGDVYGTQDYARCGSKESKGRNLAFFDAIIFYTNGETRLTDAQKRDMMDWIKSGKGFIGIHTATATGVYWPEYGEMIGGYFDNHPWGVTPGTVIVERPDFPGMSAFVANPNLSDEFYEMTGEPYSRDNTDVLARLDVSRLDMTNPQVHRTDGDFPIAWVRNFGQGRVFYSDLGHPDSAWDDPRVANMYLEAMKWVTGVTDYTVRPHPMPR